LHQRDDLEPLIDQAADMLRCARHAVALAGAGLSVESGIPAYRGADGLWTRFGEPTIDGWEQFQRDPAGWWREVLAQDGTSEFAKAIDAARPNPAHYAMADMERMGRLAHVITQNIDNLSQAAGLHGLTEIHGNRRRVRCMSCGARDRFETLSFERLPPTCPECGGILKTDVVMFGEPIPADALTECYRQAALADLFLVVGTSAVVYPAAEFPLIARQHGARIIEVNPAETALTEAADLVVRGPAGQALPAIVERLKAGLPG
jgi:NAD-dependent deacetylase